MHNEVDTDGGRNGMGEDYIRTLEKFTGGQLFSERAFSIASCMNAIVYALLRCDAALRL